jgi:hypothetical protein
MAMEVSLLSVWTLRCPPDRAKRLGYGTPRVRRLLGQARDPATSDA